MIAILQKHQQNIAEKTAYVLFDPQKNSERRLTYKQLASFTEQIGLQLLDLGYAGKTAILIYNNPLQFIIAFFACQYAGIIPVPVLFSNSKRQVEKIMQVRQDSGAPLILSDEVLKNIVEKYFRNLLLDGICQLYCIPADMEEKAAPSFERALPGPVAFIQYTSGSTSAPKGVIVSQENLAHNHKVISEAFSTNADSVLFSWLPFQHDMGLVGIILHSFFIGSTAVLMSPLDFMQQPLSWLQGISKYRATHSGAPNFAFDFCVERIKPAELKELDLSAWRLAFNGSQPVRIETIERFAKYFEPAGFRADAAFPCYGLAEATLMVTGGKKYKQPLVSGRTGEHRSGDGLNVSFDNKKLVSCGVLSDMVDVIIYSDDTVCSEGEEGEILVAGESVTSGYWNRDAADMFKILNGKRYLKTGDIGFIKDRELFVCGRLKEMLIVQGVNVYPYEIEQRLAEVETSCEQNGIALFQTDGGMGDEVVVVAEIKRALLKTIQVESVLARLEQHACEWLGIVPYDIVLLPPLGIPRTTSGKIKRVGTGRMYHDNTLPVLASMRTLPVAADSSFVKALPVAVQKGEPAITSDDLEKYVVALIAAKTNERPIARADYQASLFSLGLDSLRLAEIINSVNKELDIQLRLDTIVQENTLDHLLKNINKEVALKKDRNPVVLQEKREELPAINFPATGAQRRLWLLSQFEKAGPAYNIVVRCNLKGGLDINIIQQSIEALVNRHESLRTVFRFREGILEQWIKPEMSIQLEVRDIASMAETDQKSFLCRELLRVRNNSFDLENGPLIQPCLYKLSAEVHVLVIGAQHLISDGTSLGLIMQELLDHYAQLKSGTTAADSRNVIQYRQYAAWQNEQQGQLHANHADFWKKSIPSEPVYLELPLSFPRTGTRSFEGNRARCYSGQDFNNSIQQFCRSQGITVFNFYRATLAILLSKITGQQTIPIGVPVWGRPNQRFETAVGLFVNTLPLISICPADTTVSQFLQETATDSLRALAHQEYPFDQVLEGLNYVTDRNRNPLFDVMMVCNDTGTLATLEKAAAAAGFEISGTDGWLYDYQDYESAGEGAQMDLAFIFNAEPGGHHYIDIEYCSKLFDRDFIQRLIQYYKAVIHQVLTAPETKISAIRLLTAAEEAAFFSSVSQTRHPFDQEATLTDLFERSVAAMPQAIAVTGEGGPLTRLALNERSNRLAHYLMQKYEIEPDTVIAIKMNRTEWMLIAILAVLKSGGAYLPVSPDYPAERISYILNNSGCNIILDETAISDFRKVQADYSGSNPARKHHPANLAYIIYTSGSTGHPKGCMLEHRGVVNRLEWMWKVLGFDNADVILQKTTFTFDVSVWELLLPVCYGAKMVICNNEQVLSPGLLAKLIHEQQVTCLHFVPSALNAFLEFGFDQTPAAILLGSLKKVILSGEALTAELVRKWTDTTSLSIPLYNLYGPTEASIDVTSYRVQATDRAVPIGRPIWNTRIYILNEKMQLQPPGITGELYLAGVGLARGYINNPELTEERFLPNPYEPGQKFYKTGDLGRWLPDGNIEYLGRKDDQVKIRGHRIELEEIERVLVTHQGIKDAAVVVRKNSTGEDEIAAFIVSDEKLTADTVRNYLGAQLPAYMLPEAYIQLPALPLNNNGKTDKKSLRTTNYSPLRSSAVISEPATAVEKDLLEIWQQVLGRQPIGIHDNFFDIGGNSLKVLNIVQLINKKLQVDLPVVKLFQYSTIHTLADFITAGEKSLDHADAEENRNKSVEIMVQTLKLINND